MLLTNWSSLLELRTILIETLKRSKRSPLTTTSSSRYTTFSAKVLAVFFPIAAIAHKLLHTLHRSSEKPRPSRDAEGAGAKKSEQSCALISKIRIQSKKIRVDLCFVQRVFEAKSLWCRDGESKTKKPTQHPNCRCQSLENSTGGRINRTMTFQVHDVPDDIINHSQFIPLCQPL